MTLRRELAVRYPVGSSSARRATLRTAIVVVAVLTAMFGVPFMVTRQPRLNACSDSASEIARTTARRFVYEAYLAWRDQHPGHKCPASIDELLPWMNTKAQLDPWGARYVLLCSDGQVVVASAGPDGDFFTDDDVSSLP